MSVKIPPDLTEEERLTKIRRHEARWRPGAVAYTALAVLIAIALVLAALTSVAERNRAFRASAANCRVSESISGAFVDLLNHTTGPRILGKGATPTQRAAQAAANAEASVYRETELAKLRAVSCSKLADGTPVAVPVSVPSPPPTVVGPAGDRGVAGLTGIQGVAGKQGATGSAGKRGTTGATGANGSPGENGGTGSEGPPGPAGAAGADGTNGADGAPGSTGPLPPSFTFTFDLNTVTCVLDVDTYTCTTTTP